MVFLRPAFLTLILGMALLGAAPSSAQSPSDSTARPPANGELLQPAAPSLNAPAASLPGPATLPLESPQIIAPAGNGSTGTETLSSTPQSLIPGSLNMNTPAPEGTAIDPKDIPDIVMKEVEDVERTCNANYFYSSFHDCRCIAVNYLDARLKSDPDQTPKSVVLESVGSTCANEPGVAGFIYTSCEGFMKVSRPDDYAEFCRCTANNVAENYVKHPAMNMRYIENLRKNALIACGISQNPTYQSPYRR